MRFRPQQDVTDLMSKCMTEDPVKASIRVMANVLNAVRKERDLDAPSSTRQGVSKRSAREPGWGMGQDLCPKNSGWQRLSTATRRRCREIGQEFTSIRARREMDTHSSVREDFSRDPVGLLQSFR